MRMAFTLVVTLLVCAGMAVPAAGQTPTQQVQQIVDAWASGTGQGTQQLEDLLSVR